MREFLKAADDYSIAGARSASPRGDDNEGQAFEPLDADALSRLCSFLATSRPEFTANANLSAGMTRNHDLRDLPDHCFGPGLRSPPSSQPEAPGELDDLDPEAREDHGQIPWPGRENQRENDRDEQRHKG
jgi:hypothetical protein